MDDIEYLKSCVKSIKDFPKSGILFSNKSSNRYSSTVRAPDIFFTEFLLDLFQ